MDNKAFAMVTMGNLGLSPDEAAAIWRAYRTLQSWAEQECGTEHHCIVEVADGKWERQTTLYRISGTRIVHQPIANRRDPARRRIQAICDKRGLFVKFQNDPRGAVVIIDDKPITDRTEYSAKVRL